MRLNLVALVSQTQGNLQENNRKYDFEAVSEPFTSTEDIISTCISPVNNASGTSSDDDNSNSLVVDIVQESATDSNEENFFAVADDPDCSETKSDSFSVFPAIFVPNESFETTLESDLRDTFVPESTPTCSTESSNACSKSKSKLPVTLLHTKSYVPPDC